DLFNKFELQFFTIFFPLFRQTRKPNSFFPVFFWVLLIIQLISLALFRIDNSTQSQSALSEVVNYIDLSSLSLKVGKYSIYLVAGFLNLLIIFFILLMICAYFFRHIVETQPWFITFVRVLHDVLLRVLSIPIASVCITMFDCYNIIETNEAGEEIKISVWRAANDNICMGSMYQVVGTVLAAFTFTIVVVYCCTIDLLIYNHNPKNGGLFSCPDGLFNFIQRMFILSLVFILRYIYPWEFWRGVASIGDSIILIVYIVYKQPYYTLKSNFLAQIPWIIFGSVRLCAEIGYALERRFYSIIPQIILLLISTVITIILSYGVFLLTKSRMKKLWMLSNDEKPLFK
ncbi:MAG: hypothetical protein EZS28_049826, partial [Streblomastix strix]